MIERQNRRVAIASARRPAPGKKDDYVPFLVRFQAWWEGVEPGVLMRRRKKTPPRRSRGIDVGSPASLRHGESCWPKKRIQIVQRLYGEGFIHVGGLAYAKPFMARLGLNESKSVLDLSSGLGGLGRYLANEYGSWVTGLEAEKELAEIGMQMSEREGFKEKAPLKVFDPEHVEILDRRYHCILTRERLHTVKNKTRLLRQMADSLAPGGKMVLMEFVVTDNDAKEADLIKAWCNAEFETPTLWSEDELKDSVYRLQLELQSYSNESESYGQTVLKDWDRFTKGLKKGELDQEFVDIMMQEAEINKSRTEAMNAGLL
ncbi:MAG: class I SAM-dependent methyltransferase, partial [Proteobacteria bacterium]|nr:class I SAM-dependent methyltransferase [Pseudomonadota bacterium]